MTSIFEGQPPKNKAEIPIKTRVIWVLGIYIYIYLLVLYDSTNEKNPQICVAMVNLKKNNNVSNLNPYRNIRIQDTPTAYLTKTGCQGIVFERSQQKTDSN